jgi:hypothetical protein
MKLVTTLCNCEIPTATVKWNHVSRAELGSFSWLSTDGDLYDVAGSEIVRIRH